MTHGEIEEFAEIVVKYIRDQAVRGCDVNRRGVSPPARRWREAMAESAEKTAEVMIPDCVDEVVFRLLLAIDEGALPLKFVSKSGRVVDLKECGRGELAGWYMTSDGWRNRYSKERFVDDAADLELDD